MKSLTERYNDIWRNESPVWAYYEGMHDSSIVNVLFRADCKDFIRNAFESSCKLSGNIESMLNMLPTIRLKHIVSTYFLGIDIYCNSDFIRASIDSQLSSLTIPDHDNSKRFSYIWFLICFFHDLGYSIETGLYKVNFYEYEGDISSWSSNRINRIIVREILPSLFTNDLFESYRNYRHTCMGVFDHGIYGACMCFEEIIKNVVSERCPIDMGLPFDSFEEAIDNYKSCLRQAYRVAASIILSHNIFTTSSSSTNAECYRCNNLTCLIDQDYLIKSNSHALLFLFDLVDTVEPIKRDFLSNELANIKWEISSDKMLFDLSSMNGTKRNFFKAQLLGMNSWLTFVAEIEDQVIVNLQNVKLLWRA